MRKKTTLSFLILGFLILSFSQNKVAKDPYITNYSSNKKNIEIPTTKENPLTFQGIALGRLLFYDTTLSGNNKQSCGSCHQQKFGFTDGKAKSIGSTGLVLKRNSMSLQNLAWQNRFFWDGRVATLEELIIIPITDSAEMNQNTTELINELYNSEYYPVYFNRVFNDSIKLIYIQKAISQFLKSIISFDTKMEIFQYDNPLDYVNEKYKNDKEYIQFIIDHKKRKTSKIVNLCGNCHGGITYGSKKFSTNGFVDTTIEKGLYNSTLKEKDIGLLKAPTLRNIKQTAPYMHDGSLRTLEEVLKHYSTHIRNIPTKNLSSEFIDKKGKLILPKLKDKDIKHLKKMFDYMTDSIYLENLDYTNPFEGKFSWENYEKKYFLNRNK